MTTEQVRRQTVAVALDHLRVIAQVRGDDLLAMTTHALASVHSLFAEHDTLASRGTPLQQARVAVNNAIADVLAAHLDDQPDSGQPDGPPEPAN